MATPIPIYCIIAFAPILRDADVQTPTISKAQLLYHAKLWRRKQGQSIATIVGPTMDAKLNKLISRIDAIPIVDPPINKQELEALFSLYLENRDLLMPNVWEEFCTVLKDTNAISFNLGVRLLGRCVDSLVPFKKVDVPNGALDRLFDDLIPDYVLNSFLTKATKQQHDVFWPSIFEFFSVIGSLFEHDPHAIISSNGVTLDGRIVEYPLGWSQRLTLVLAKIKNKSKK